MDGGQQKHWTSHCILFLDPRSQILLKICTVFSTGYFTVVLSIVLGFSSFKTFYLFSAFSFSILLCLNHCPPFLSLPALHPEVSRDALKQPRPVLVHKLPKPYMSRNREKQVGNLLWKYFKLTLLKTESKIYGILAIFKMIIIKTSLLSPVFCIPFTGNRS